MSSTNIDPVLPVISTMNDPLYNAGYSDGSVDARSECAHKITVLEDLLKKTTQQYDDSLVIEQELRDLEANMQRSLDILIDERDRLIEWLNELPRENRPILVGLVQLVQWHFEQLTKSRDELQNLVNYAEMRRALSLEGTPQDEEILNLHRAFDNVVQEMTAENETARKDLLAITGVNNVSLIQCVELEERLRVVLDLQQKMSAELAEEKAGQKRALETLSAEIEETKARRDRALQVQQDLAAEIDLAIDVLDGNAELTELSGTELHRKLREHLESVRDADRVAVEIIHGNCLETAMEPGVA